MTTAIKKTAAAKPNIKSKLKPNSKSIDSGNNDDNNDDDNVKKKRSIYKIMQTWHHQLKHLNIDNIIQLCKDS